MESRFKFRAWIKDYKMMLDAIRLNYDGSIEAILTEDDDFSEFWPSEIELM